MRGLLFFFVVWIALTGWVFSEQERGSQVEGRASSAGSVNQQGSIPSATIPTHSSEERFKEPEKKILFRAQQTHIDRIKLRSDAEMHEGGGRFVGTYHTLYVANTTNSTLPASGTIRIEYTVKPSFEASPVSWISETKTHKLEEDLEPGESVKVGDFRGWFVSHDAYYLFNE